jgi:phospholipid/cholesterol/gamma-HCH transport system substrate-binding protein
VRTAIRKHLGDFLAILALVALATGTAGYILTQERFRFPLISEKPFDVQADFTTAQAVMPGQGQTVRIAGVKVGNIGKVQLINGRARVTFEIDKKYAKRIHSDATALLRPKTGVKDMFVELDPGTKSAPAMKANEVIPVQNTAPDVNPDEVLSTLDGDTRSYLQLLVNGLGNGLNGRGKDLRNVFERLGPTHRDLARVATAVAARRQNLRRLVHNYGDLMNTLSTKDKEIARLVDEANAVFDSFASEKDNLATAVARLPGALNQTSNTLQKVNSYSQTLGPALQSLRPPFRKLDSANKAVLPFVKEATPELQNQIRPFVRTARPYVRDNLRPAAVNLAKAVPDLTSSFHELNRFFNMAAFNPNGKEKLTGDKSKDLARDEGYLYWLAWVAQNSNSLFSTSDAGGPFRRIILNLNCNTIKSAVTDQPILDPIIGNLTNVLADPGLCGGANG